MELTDKLFLITGSGGQLAKEFQRSMSSKNIKFIAPKEEELDMADFKKVGDSIKNIKPDCIINCAAYNAVDNAEDEQDKAFLINSQAVENLSILCKKYKIFFVHYSTDYVFDGLKKTPYVEEDKPSPINKYGESKLKGEIAVRKHLNEYLIFRLSWVIGDGKQNFLYKVYQWAKTNNTLKISIDEVSSCTYTEDVVNVSLLACRRGLRGLYHLANSGYCSRYELARYFIQKIGLSNTIEGVSVSSFQSKARRPLFSCMSNQKLSKELDVRIPEWKDGVDRFIKRDNFNQAIDRDNL